MLSPLEITSDITPKFFPYVSTSYYLSLTSVCSFSALQTQVYSQNLPACPTLITSFLPQKIYLFSTMETTSSFTFYFLFLIYCFVFNLLLIY